jgi:hypothetical protein
VADKIVVKNEGNTDYQPHPEGQVVVLCVDVIDLGEKLDMYGGKAKIAHKAALVFQSAEVNPDTGKHYELQREFTVSSFAKANLRMFLESWRGKKYTDEQLEDGIPLHKLERQPGLANIEHRESGAGRIYANIQSLVPVPKGLAVPELTGYERAPYWAERKAKYLADVTAYRAVNQPPPPKDPKLAADAGAPPPEEPGWDDDDDSSLPF